MRVPRGLAVLLAAGLVLALGGCAGSGGDSASIVHKDTLVIGVPGDEPGLGTESGGKFSGFDVAVARYVATTLGVDAQHVTFTAVTPGDQASDLADGKVDLVVADYAITPEAADEVAFAGPYYVAHQDVMVRAAENSISDVRDLAGKSLCQVRGSDSARRITHELKIPAVPVPARSYRDCAAQLSSGKVDAVSTDDLVLAGLVARHSDLRILNAPFSNEKYGIGVKKSDLTGCEAVNRAVTQMYQDATAQILLANRFGKTGLHTASTVPQFEGCA